MVVNERSNTLIDFKDVIADLRKHKYLYLVTLTIFVVAGFALCLILPNVYRASAVLEGALIPVLDERSRVLSWQEAVPASVFKDLLQDTTYLNRLFDGQGIKVDDYPEVEVILPRGTIGIVKLYVDAKSPEQAISTLNLIYSVFIDKANEKNSEEKVYIKKEILKTKNNLESINVELKEYKKKIDELLKDEEENSNNIISRCVNYSSDIVQQCNYGVQLSSYLFSKINYYENKIQYFTTVKREYSSQLQSLLLQEQSYGTVKWLSEPAASKHAVKPKRLLIVGVSFLLGLALVIFSVFTRVVGRSVNKNIYQKD